MNRLILAFALTVAFSFMTCQEAKEDLKSPVVEKEFYKTVGEEIPFETGMEWIAYYKEKNPGQGRTELLSDYSVSSEQLTAALASVPDLVGVAFHHAIDDNGSSHIIVIPVDGSLLLWSTIPGRTYIDANTGTAISPSVASAWAQNYKTANPSSIWFHFFGKNIFDDMAALPFFNNVIIAPAINILNLKPQLLLVVYNDILNPLGRTQDEPGIAYDASNPCPPCAVH